MSENRMRDGNTTVAHLRIDATLPTTGSTLKQFLTLVAVDAQDGDGWVFDLIEHALEIGVPTQEIPEAVVAWSWAGEPMDSHFDSYEGFPELEAEFFRFNEGPESKWNDSRHMADRFPDHYTWRGH